MRYTPDRARYEAALSRAHRAIFAAEELAEALGDPGAAYDLHLIALELVRLAEGSLRNKPGRRSAPATDRA